MSGPKLGWDQKKGDRPVSLLESMTHTKEAFRIEDNKLKADWQAVSDGSFEIIVDGTRTLRLDSHDNLVRFIVIKKESAGCQANTSGE